MAWDQDGGSSILPCFDTVAARDAAYPTPSLGQKACVKRLCGNGYFEMSYEGSRWAVRPGESIIRDSGGVNSPGYPLTVATSSVTVVLSSYVIPAGIIGDGEDWECDAYTQNTGTYIGGIDYLSIVISGLGINVQSSLSGANKVGRGAGCVSFVNGKGVALGGSNGGWAYSNQPNADAAISVSSANTISAGFYTGAIGNTIKIRLWSFRRIA